MKSGKTEREGRRQMREDFFLLNIFIFLFFFLLIVGCKLEAHPFNAGEKLTYRITLWGIPVGEQILEVKNIVQINERLTYHLHSRVKTSGWTDFLLSRMYSVESFVDIETLYPYEIRNYASEGSSPPKNIVVHIDQEKAIALFEDKDTQRKWERELPNLAIDTISLIYWLRSKSLQVGDEFSFFLIEDSSLRNLRIKVVKKEKIRESLAFLCSEVDSDKIKIWLSADGKRLPLRIKVDLGGALPTLTSELTRVE